MLKDYFNICRTLYEAVYSDGELTAVPFTVSDSAVFDGIGVYLPDKLVGQCYFTESDINTTVFDNPNLKRSDYY